MYGHIVPGATSGARRAQNDVSSARTLHRLKVLDWHQAHGANVSVTARHFGHARTTVERWLKRYDCTNLSTLEDRSRAPTRRRRPTWSPELVLRVQQLREEFPRWGKDKLVVLLRNQGQTCSTSMVGRMLTDLRARRVLKEPLLAGVSARKRLTPRPYATRKPKASVASQPGDIVQLDTFDIRTGFSHPLKRFTARDVVSGWDVLEVHSAATASLAAKFYELYDGPWSVTAIRPELLAWEMVYNTVRPHQTLGYLTPEQWLAQHPPPHQEAA
jgi:putative transposase